MGSRGEAPLFNNTKSENIMINKIKGNISYYNDASDSTSQCWVEFDKILSLIKESPQWLIDLTDNIKQCYSISNTAYKETKKLLPMICPSGRFKYRDGQPSNLIEYSNILILDFDWENPDKAVIENFRQQLIRYATPLHIYAIWKSPAKGLKVAMLHSNRDSAFHTELFNQVKDNLYPRTPQLDMKCKDITRACFICHDPDLFVNIDPDLDEFQFHHNPSYLPPVSVSNQSIPQHTTYGQFQHTSQEILMNKGWQLTCTDKKLMNMLVKSCNAANPEYYKDGNRHTEVLRRAILYCKDGILYENAVWSLTGQFGEDSRAELKNDDIESMVNSCYNKARAEFGTERNAFIGSRKKK